MAKELVTQTKLSRKRRKSGKDKETWLGRLQTAENLYIYSVKWIWKSTKTKEKGNKIIADVLADEKKRAALKLQQVEGWLHGKVANF